MVRLAWLLAQSYVREVNEGATFAWCPEWYKHPEALIRMEAIWRPWEHLRLEPALGVSTWWLNHADPHMRLQHGPTSYRRRASSTEPGPTATAMTRASELRAPCRSQATPNTRQLLWAGFMTFSSHACLVSEHAGGTRPSPTKLPAFGINLIKPPESNSAQNHGREIYDVVAMDGS